MLLFIFKMPFPLILIFFKEKFSLKRKKNGKTSIAICEHDDDDRDGQGVINFKGRNIRKWLSDIGVTWREKNH